MSSRVNGSSTNINALAINGVPVNATQATPTTIETSGNLPVSGRIIFTGNVGQSGNYFNFPAPTVSSVANTDGTITVAPTTGDVVVSLPAVGTAGTFTYATITKDAYGRVSSASSGATPITYTNGSNISISGTAINVLSNPSFTGSITTSLTNTANAINVSGTGSGITVQSATNSNAFTANSGNIQALGGYLRGIGLYDGTNGTTLGTSGYLLQTTSTSYKWIAPPTTIYTASTSATTLTTVQNTISWSPTPTITLATGSLEVSGILVFLISATIAAANSSIIINVLGGSTGATSISTTQLASIPIGTLAGQYFAIPFKGYSATTGIQQVSVKIQGSSVSSVATLQNTSQMTLSYNK